MDPTSQINRKRVSEMTSEERLASLQQWAEEQKYVRPGEGGTLPTGPRSISALAFGGPMSSYSEQPQYTAPIGPPSYELATRKEPEKQKRGLKRLFGKHEKEKKKLTGGKK